MKPYFKFDPFFIFNSHTIKEINTLRKVTIVH